MTTCTTSFHLVKLKPNEDIAFDRNSVTAGLFGKRLYRAWIAGLHLFIPGTRDVRSEISYHAMRSFQTENHMTHGDTVVLDAFLKWEGYDLALKLHMYFSWDENYKSFKLSLNRLQVSSLTGAEGYVHTTNGIGAAISSYMEQNIKLVGYDLVFEPTEATEASSES